MDAYFASIEQRDNPKLIGKPVIISGDVNKRSVVSTCSYEARAYGIYSSMPSKVAYRLCPNGIYIKPRIEYYKTISEEIFSIFNEFTTTIEPLSLDEAFLDVSESVENIETIAKEIKKTIYEREKLTCSAGGSYNKFFAKIASDYNKPNGLMIIDKQNYEKVLDSLDIKKIYGIGRQSIKKLNEMGVYTGKDLRNLSEEQLNRVLYSRGSIIYRNIRGLDDRPVESNRERKSIGKEKTYDQDIKKQELTEQFHSLATVLSEELVKRKIEGKTILIKIKYCDFRVFSRRMTNNSYVQSVEELRSIITLLLDKYWNEIEDINIRLIGIYLYNLGEKTEYKQLSIFDLL